MEITQIDSQLQVKPRTNIDLGKDDFLFLLIQQLRHQDPLNPMSDRDFIAQMAQFNSLEQMMNLNRTFEKFFLAQSLSSASALIGKEVTGFDTQNELTRGTVEKVVAQKGSLFLKVGEHLLPLEKIEEVKAVL